MSPHNSWLVSCGDTVVIVAMCNATTMGDVAVVVGVAAADDFLVVVGATAAVVVWVQ